MTQLHWLPAFEVGNNLIDSQHQRLFQLMRNLHQLLYGTDAVDNASRALDELLDYARIHLQDEELLMIETEYPQFAAHRRQHQEFWLNVEALLQRRSQGEDVGLDLLTLVNWWLIEHILGADKHFGTYLSRVAPREGASSQVETLRF